jgi:FAD:protein FMN transferase
MLPTYRMLKLLAGILFVCLQSLSSLQATELQRYEFSEPHMGMLVRVVLYAADEQTAKAGSRVVFERFRALNAIFSDYDPTSELSRLSATVGKATPQRVSADLWKLLTFSQQLSEHSAGAFDISVGPLTQLWRKSKRSRELPATDVLREAIAATGYQHIELHAQEQTVLLKKPGMKLDAGGIAVGYAIDESLAELKRHGITCAMIDASGDIGCSEPPPGEVGWRIGIAPLNPNALPSKFLRLKNIALTTSGDAFQAITIDGKRYSHIVSPQTGLGLTRPMAVTVLAKTAIEADSLATTLSVLGPEAGQKLLQKYPGSIALCVLAPQRQNEAAETHTLGDWQPWEEAPRVAPQP